MNIDDADIDSVFGSCYTVIKNQPDSEMLDFRRWLEQVLVEAARGEDRKEIGKLIAALQKGDDEVIHGLQRTIMEEYAAGVRSGRRQGRKQGVEQGAKALIETCRELKCTREDTAVRVKNKFQLSEKGTMRYMNKFWPMEEI